MSYIYQYQTGLRLEFDTDYSVANIASAIIKYEKPSGECGQWTAAIGSDTVIYKNGFLATDLDEKGLWKLQPVITNTDGKTIPCKIVEMRIYKALTCND